jgi:hypothetical protein
MNQSKRWHRLSLSIGLLLVWCTVTAWLTAARIRNPNFGAQGDLPVHYHLLRAFWQSTQEGDWFPHWAGLLDGGRGDAFFTFYPPLSYWLSVIAMKLGGLSLIGALKFLTALSFWLAQLNAYWLARAFFARKTSLLVSVSYVLLPTFPLIALHRSFLPNALALSFVPLLLLGAHRLLNEGKGFLLFALSLSAIILTHVITAYLCIWVLLLLAIGQFGAVRNGERERPALPDDVSLAGAGRLRFLFRLLSALTLTAFFWLPQQLEMHWVQVGLQLTQQDFTHHLLFARAPQDTPFRRTWAILNEIVSWMTLLQTALAFVLAAALWRIPLSNTQRIFYRWSTSVAAFGLLIALPFAAPLWRVIPGLAFIQFPWRWQPLTALAAAWLAALAWTHWHNLTPLRRVLTLTLSVLCVIGALVFSFGVIQAPADEFTQRTLLSELNERSFAPLPFETVRELPDEIKELRMAVTANQVYFRPRAADRMIYPPTQTYGGLTILRGRGAVTVQTLNNQYRHFQITAAEPLQVRFETYAYPHWTALLNGQPLPIQTEANSGLILLALPAGEHALTLQFAPRWRWANWLSLLAWLALIGWTGWRWFAQRKTDR